MDQEKIGNLIKKLREENNLTQKDLADKLGVTYQAVSKWENGKNIPDIGVMKQISEDFSINLDEILNGEKIKKDKRKKLLLIVPFLLLIIIISIIILKINNNSDFEFKTISSKCSEFKISGSAAYNKNKTSIYISNIEFCGNEDKEVYKNINCILYEKINNNKKEISSCAEKENSTLENYLKDININVDNASCKNLVSNTLFLEIVAENNNGENKTYTIPIKLNDNCK